MRKYKHPELTALAHAGYAAIWRSIEAEKSQRKGDTNDEMGKDRTDSLQGHGH